MTNKNSVLTKEHVIAFVDILGATEKMNENQDEMLQIVYNIYKDVLTTNSSFNKSFLDGYNTSGELEKREEPILKLNIFSDNILFSSMITGGNSLRSYRVIDSLLAVIISVSMFQLHLSMNGMLLRGGITLGSLYSDEILTWGTGLVRAATLEKKYAKNPRVIIDTNLLDFKFNEMPIIMERLSFEDDFYFIDYLKNKFIEDDICQIIEELEKNNNLEIRKKEGNHIINNNCFRDLKKLYWQKKYLDKRKVIFVRGNE